jgi:hypothetical protein
VVDRTKRPIVPVVHFDEVEHRRLLAMRANASLTNDATNSMEAPLGLKEYATADLPNATIYAGAIVYDSTVGAVAFSDGANWIYETSGHVEFLDRAALTAATIATSTTRVYVRYYSATAAEPLNAEASAPRVSGHWLRRHTISGSGTDAARLANGWADAQSGQYWLQTDISPNKLWWWLSNTGLYDDPIWYRVGTVGYAWATSNGGTVYWMLDEIEPNACQCGGLNGTFNAPDDTIPLQDLADIYSTGRDCLVPEGYYSTTDTITLQTLGRNVFRGEGGLTSTKSTIITCANDNAIEISELLGGQGFGGQLRDFVVIALTGDGIRSLLTVEHGVRLTEWSGVAAIGNTSGFRIPYCYSVTFRNCMGACFTDGCGWEVRGGVGTLFEQCGGAAAGTLQAAFRIGGHPCTFVACNTVHNVFGSGNCAYGYLLGVYASVSSTAAAGAATTITLNAGSTFVTDQIVGRNIVLTAGTGSGQTRRCTAYNSGTKVATVDSAWSVNPAAGTSYTIQDPISIMRNLTDQGTYTFLNSNAEAMTKTGLRTLNDCILTVVGCTFDCGGGAESPIRLAPNTGSSSIAIVNANFETPGSAAADIVSEGIPIFDPQHGGVYFNVVSGNVEAYGTGVSTTVGKLPTASALPAGTRSFVTDALVSTFHNVVAAGGTAKVPVVTDNAGNWLIG